MKKLMRLFFAFIGISVGLAVHFALVALLSINNITLTTTMKWGSLGAIVLLFIILFQILTPMLIKWAHQVVGRIEREAANIGVFEMMLSLLGIIIGLIIAYFISGFTTQIPLFGTVITFVVYAFFTFLGYTLSTKRKDEISVLLKNYKMPSPKEKSPKKNPKESPIPKVLDTSVIIDGRIRDIAETGFVEGKLIVPGFVLEELRHIADSSDDLKRTKGRRGLDILNDMQSNLKLDMEIYEGDFPEIAEVDMKLLKLAQIMDGKVLTNDYNLNKVAQFQGVKVLNINELANAVKTVVIPGEDMTVVIVKEGKEHNQGVAYLDDGTMIVVENAKRQIGETLIVTVTTVLQTAAGRMIFAKQK